MLQDFKLKKGFSIVEILISISVFSLSAFAIVYFSIDSLRANQNASKKITSVLAMQEIYNALVQNKSDLWSFIVDSTNNGPKHLVYNPTSYKYDLVNGNSVIGDLTLSFAVIPALRDNSGNLSSSGTISDPHTRLITITAQWIDIYSQTNTKNIDFYVSDWNTIDWFQTTQADFDTGSKYQTVSRNKINGEMELEQVTYGNWCKPELTLSSYNIPGIGLAQAASVTQGKVMMGTGINSNGVTLIGAKINPGFPPTVTVEGSISGYVSTGIYTTGNLTYVSTNDANNEILIVDTSTSNYSIIGKFDAPGDLGAKSIFVVGNRGYMTTGNKFYVFDLSAQTGSRPMVGAGLTLAGTGQRIVIRNNYAYVATSSSSTQLQIIDISNPTIPVIVGQAGVAGSGAVSVAVNSTQTRAYILTNLSLFQKEFFIVDISTKTGNRPTKNSINIGSILTLDLTVPTDDRAIVVGAGFSNQYQCFTLGANDAITNCGSLTTGSFIYALDSITETDGNTYSYIITSVSQHELQIIRGGAGGGGGETGLGYIDQGTYTSKILNSGSDIPRYYYFEPRGSIAANTTLRLQLRTSNDPAMNGATWVGPDGTASTYFNLNQNTIVPANLSNKRYIQYKAYFTSDTISTAVLEQVNLNYQK